MELRVWLAWAYIEAGLRTGDKYSPFPEEVNRRLLDAITDLCLAPTERARRALLAEGVASLAGSAWPIFAPFIGGFGAFVAGSAVGLPAAGILEDEDAAAAFPPRPAGAHKGTFGHVLGVAGSAGKAGEIDAITNGVHVATWLGHDVADIACSTDGGYSWSTLVSSVGGRKILRSTSTAFL